MAEHIMHSFDTPAVSPSPDKLVSYPKFAIWLACAVCLGLISGYTITYLSGKTPALIGNKMSGTSSQDDKKANSAGIKDSKQFPDKAEGVLKEGGVEGEGSHHLERPGGTSQNVYLTSTTVDLSGFVGKKVSVLGQTFEAQHAGWLMDVGYIEIK